MSSAILKFREAVRKAEENVQNDEKDVEEKEYVGLNPPQGTLVARPATVDYTAKFAQIRFSIPELPAEFNDIPALRFEVTSKNDFPDDQMKGIDAISLKIISDEETIGLGRDVFKRMSHGMSQYHVCGIFLLAYQLKRPGMGLTTHFMPKNDDLARAGDVSIEILDKSILENSGSITEPTETGTPSQVAQGYAYLAASLLKMFTRSPENYIKSWSHIRDGYKQFYYTSCPISGITPDISVVRVIHDHFSMSHLCKAALYRFLYNVNRDGEVDNVQKYLYDIHLSHTGMHIVPIVYRLCMAMNCEPKIPIRVINANRFRPQILGLIAAFKLMGNSDEKHKRQMWKYGRVFDSSFLAALQTKICPKLGFLLACCLKRESAESASGILEIRQFSEVSVEDRAKLWAGSEIILQAINHLIDTDPNNLMVQIMNA